MLLDMVGKLQLPNVALVHQVPFTADNPGFSAAVEKVSAVLCHSSPIGGLLLRVALFINKTCTEMNTHTQTYTYTQTHSGILVNF